MAVHENNKNQTVPEGSIQLYKGLPRDEAINFAKLFWYLTRVEKDEKGVWIGYTRTKKGEMQCCKMGLYRQIPAILNNNGDGTEHLLVGGEILKDIDKDIVDPTTDKVPMKEDEVSEMTGTGAVAGFASPMAFSKRKVKEGKALVKGKVISLKESDRKLYENYVDSLMGDKQITEQKKKELEEMTTTGDVSGYNVPSAFSGKGGSKKGVAGSAALGYTLTAVGQKEMERQGDRLLENEQPVRRQRCAKCKRLKPTDSHGYIEGWECYDCRKGGVE